MMLGRPSFDKVLRHVRKSAAQTGRVYAICYDLSGTPAEQIENLITSDWKRLVETERITKDQTYLHHQEKPVVFVWGFFEDRFEAELAHRVIDFFQKDGPYQATVDRRLPVELADGPRSRVGQGVSQARRDQPLERGKLHHDRPSEVGGHRDLETRSRRSQGTWGGAFCPWFIPASLGRTSKAKRAVRDTIPRLKGQFYWRQFVTAAELEMPMVYVAMFDEVDEATAIFKVTNHPPTNANFADLRGTPRGLVSSVDRAPAES
jgi:hypothetical protein